MVRRSRFGGVRSVKFRYVSARQGGQGGVRQVLVLSGLVRRGGLGVSR